VENLDLTGAAADATGNALVNVIVGNAANNVIDGREGNDTLTGGTGRDVFLFDTALDAITNVDTITDFSTRNSDDSLRLDNAVFTQLQGGLLGGARVLDAGHFHVGTAAADGDDYIIYDNHTGALFYDADGDGSVSQAIHFATLTGAPPITAVDIGVI
jgi:Ca2+-binding RTX toxin-like protein